MIRVDGHCAGAWIAYLGCKGVLLDPSTRLVDLEPGNAQLCSGGAYPCWRSGWRLQIEICLLRLRLTLAKSRDVLGIGRVKN